MLASQILDMVFAYVRAIDAKQISAAQCIAAAMCQLVRESKIDTSPTDMLRREVDGLVSYELVVDKGLVKVRLYDAAGDDTLHHFTPEQFAQFRADGLRVLLHIESEARRSA